MTGVQTCALPISISDPSTFKKVKVDIMSVSGDSCFVMVDNGINRYPGVVYIDRK